MTQVTGIFSVVTILAMIVYLFTQSVASALSFAMMVVLINLAKEIINNQHTLAEQINKLKDSKHT